MSPKIPSVFACAVTLLGIASAAGAWAGEVAPLVLQDSVRAVGQSAANGPVDTRLPFISRAQLKAGEASAPMTLELPLKLRNVAELEARVAKGEHISAGELAQKYEPTARDFQSVVAWARGQGLTITREDDHHLAVFVRAGVNQIAGILKVKFARVTYRGQEFTSAITPPTVPAALAGVLEGITGLQPHLRPHKHLLRRLAQPNLTGSAEYRPAQIAAAYDVTSLYSGDINGSGETIAISIDTFPATSDLEQFWISNSISQSISNIQFVQTVPGQMGAPSGEETLDTEWASSIAPGAKIRVYGATDLANADLDTTYQQILDDATNHPELNIHQMTMSYGSGESDSDPSEINNDHNLFTMLTAAGVTCFASSGDGGSTPDNNGGSSGNLEPENPADDPSVTAVGGTTLVLGSNNSVSTEKVWNDISQGGGATGGGTDGSYTGGTGSAGTYPFALPSWQRGPGVILNAKRQVPDIAATADPNYGGVVILDGQLQIYGGTSLASPICAAIFSLVNEARANAGQGAVGLLQPYLYPRIGTGNFREITSGNNATPSSGGLYSTGTISGQVYSECDGLGTPQAQVLAQSLAGASPVGVKFPAPLDEVAPGATATFSVAVSGASAGYQWQRRPVGGSTFTNLSDGGAYAGATTATLTVSSTTTAMSGDQFQCVVQLPAATITTSPPSSLAVETPLTVAPLAGSVGRTGTSNGSGTGALFNYPSGIALRSGNLYVADFGNNQIREITPQGLTTTPFGSVGGGPGSSNGSGNGASFNGPNAVAADSSGNLYVADSGNNLIRKIVGSSVSTLAGTGGNFSNPQGVAVDSSGNVYVADTGNDTIDKVTPGGNVTIFAGQTGNPGYHDGASGQALFNAPESVAVDSQGNVFVADLGNSAVREISNGTVSTVAGTGGVGGYLDGPASSALFNGPTGLSFDSSGDLFVTDSLVPAVGTPAAGNCVLRKISPAGAVTTVAGDPGFTGSQDGVGNSAMFNSIQAVACVSGGMYVADTYNQLVKAVGSPTTSGGGGGTVATVTLGNLTTTYNGSPQSVSVTTNPAVQSVTVTYNGSTTPPTSAGTYAVVATVSDPVYTGSASGTFVILKAAATVTLGNLTPTYNGAPQAVTVMTSPSVQAVSVTYNGGATAPTNPGTYAVVATVSDPNYSGTARDSLVIGKAAAGVTLQNLAATYNGSAQAVTAVTNPTGLNVIIVYTVNGAGTTKAPVAPGSYPVVGTISDTDYAGSGSGTLVISPGTATITLGSLTAVYNGRAHAATAVTVPARLPVTYTYNGSGVAPVAVGAYTVVGTVNTADYTGTATATLNITPIPAVVTTTAATPVTATSATLGGSANPEGSDTGVTFQYGTSAAYGFTTGSHDIGAGSAVVPVTAVIGSLNPGTLYHYRAVGNSAGGTIDGVDKTFTTLTEPNFTGGPATTLRSASGAQVGFSVNPEGVATSVSFEYSTDPAFGTFSQSAAQNIGAGKVPVNVTAFLSGLLPDTTYYYEVVTTSAAGTFTSPAQSFTTLGFNVTEVAATGQAAPGTAFNFAGFGNAAIDSLDGAAFAATTTGARTSNSGIWANQGGSALVLMAQTGAAPAPGTNGALFASLTDPVLVYDGANEDIAFGGALKVAPGLVTAANANGIWASSGGALGLVAREGETAPGAGTATFATFTSLGLADTGALFGATLTTSAAAGVTTANNTGVWEVISGNLTLMLRAAEPTDTGKTISSFTFLPVESYVNGQTRGFGPSTGHLAARAAYTDGNTGIVKVTTPGSPTAVATSTDAAAGTTGAKFATFSSPAINDSDHVAFLATLAVGVGDATKLNAGGIWADDNSGARQLVARLGQIAPGTGTNATFLSFSDPVYNDGNAVAFRATLSTGTGLATAATASGIWSNSSGSLALVAQQGHQAPGCIPSSPGVTGVTFSAFTELALDHVNGGGAIFSATLAGTGVTAANNTGIFAVDNQGALQLIVRTGDVINGKTLTALAFLPAETFVNGQARSFSAPTGDLVYNATFNDGSKAIFNVVFP